MLYPAFVLQSVNCTFMIICFTFMQLFRLDHPGQVCAGDYITPAETTLGTVCIPSVDPTIPCTIHKIENTYNIHEGFFLFVISMCVYGLIGTTCLSVCVIALCLSKKKTTEEIEHENKKNMRNTPLTGDVY